MHKHRRIPHPFTVAVDYDGTLTSRDTWPETGTVDPLAADILRKLEKDGARIILLTMREGELLEDAVKECRRAGIPLWAVNQNPDQHLWGAARKVYADAYVDDHAIAFPKTASGDADWNAIGLLLEQAMRLHKPA